MSLDRDTHDRAMTTAHPATLGDTLPAHIAFRLRRLISTAQATIDRDGHGYLAMACEPAHVTYTGLDHVIVTVYDTGDPDQAPRQFRLTVEAIEDLPYHDVDPAEEGADCLAYRCDGYARHPSGLCDACEDALT